MLVTQFVILLIYYKLFLSEILDLYDAEQTWPNVSKEYNDDS